MVRLRFLDDVSADNSEAVEATEELPCGDEGFNVATGGLKFDDSELDMKVPGARGGLRLMLLSIGMLSMSISPVPSTF